MSINGKCFSLYCIDIWKLISIVFQLFKRRHIRRERLLCNIQKKAIKTPSPPSHQSLRNPKILKLNSDLKTYNI
jgi:hypothetical protein